MIHRPWTIIAFIPWMVNLLLVGFYFSGIPYLQHLIVPDLPNVAQAREFGILENLQNIYLLLMFGLGLYALKNKPLLLEKAGALLLALFAILSLSRKLISDCTGSSLLMTRRWMSKGRCVTGTTKAIAPES